MPFLDCLRTGLENSIKLTEFKISENEKHMNTHAAMAARGQRHAYVEVLRWLECEHVPRIDSVESVKNFLSRTFPDE